MIEAVLLYLLTATSFTIGKAIYHYGAPHFFLGSRFVFTGALLLGVYWLMRRGKKMALPRSDYLTFSFFIIVFYFSFIFELLALKNMDSSKAAFLYNLSPFFSIVFAYYYFSERITLKKMIGLCIGLLGFVPELITEGNTELTTIFFLSRSEIFMFITVVATVYGWALVRLLVKKGYSPLLINGVGMLGSGILSLGVSGLQENWDPFPVWQWGPFLYLTALIVLCNDLGFYTIYSYLLKRYTTTFLSLAGLATPLMTAGLGWIFLGEPISWSFVFSFIVVFVGLVLVYSEELRQGYIVQK